MSKKKKNNLAEATSSISINGNVTLKFVCGDKVIKKKQINNTATKRLFHGIALYLIKTPSDDYTPTFMGVGSNNQRLSSDETLNRASLLSEYIGRRVILTKHLAQPVSNGYTVPFSAVFPSNLIGSENPIGEFGLFSTLSSDSLLARVSLGELEYIPAGLSLIVE